MAYSGGAYPEPAPGSNGNQNTARVGGQKVAKWGKQGYALGGQGKRLTTKQGHWIKKGGQGKWRKIMAEGPAQGMVAGNPFTKGVIAESERQDAERKGKREKQNKAAYKVASVKAPTYDPPQDPRDDTYYQNVAALDNMYGNQVAGALLEQQLDDNALATNKARYTTDRERARRDLAESLLGTGAIRSGSHRREQTERDQDYMENIDRLNYDYGNAKAQREVEIAGYGYDKQAGYNAEYQEANQRAVDALMKQAEEGEGNFALSIPRQVRQSNQKLKRLQAKRKEAKSDKQKAKIDEKIKQTRTDRARLVKRYRKSQKKKNG